MVEKKKEKKKASKKTEKETSKKKSVKEEETEGGLSLDDAFADDEDVEYGESKPRKPKKKKEEDEDGADAEELDMDLDKVENDLDEIEKMQNNGQDIEAKAIEIKASKPVASIKKGDKVKVDGTEYTVDAHYLMIDHGKTKEMAIELFDPVVDKDYQLRYFADQIETSLEFYELQEILYLKRQISKVEW